MINHTFKHRSGQCLQVPYDTALKQYWVDGSCYTLAEMERRFGLTRVPVSRFLNTRTNPAEKHWLPFDAQAQRVLYQGQWWDRQVAAGQFGLHYSPVVEQPPATGEPLKFWQGAKFTDRFNGTKHSRKTRK